ncbi:hypothetical protein BJ875DRAFT_471239 [Amylocarpus encephaloides]|uniref:DUF2415 domain-containing protein n=1 Tax=Amylocarpus encephaloides TaxID=45428 RepID=A0A9P7YCP7_9HELO|nr:hypothetical protein BJ875DRAFT_471239 [Amylocarpus encephaloides]
MRFKTASLYHATEDLILPSPRRFYHALIKKSHCQLRSLIASPHQGLVYYPSGLEIFQLNTTTGEREIITTLSFLPKCLSASKEWLCCGGDNGNYVAIGLDEQKRRVGSTTSDRDPDSRLPLDLNPSTRSLPRERLSDTEALGTSRSSRGHLSAKTARIGEELVNCIEIWSPNHTAEVAYNVPVAILSNNDHTVSIVDIAESEALDVLTIPDCVNRSFISPDGVLLASICDDPFLYIHERKPKPSAERNDENSTSRKDHEWVLQRKITLEGQKQVDKSEMRGSFAACFSLSGKYLAVASQCGAISIYETSTIVDENVDSLLRVFTSSTPDLGKTGPVQDMAFSPGPFDLLAWTEAGGRMCVADMRDVGISRQLIKIDAESKGIEKVTVLERATDNVIDPRLRSFRADPPPGNGTTPNYLGQELERRQLRHFLSREMLDRHQAPLTTEELEILQAHRIARRQRDAVNAPSPDTSPAARFGHWIEGPRSSSSNTLSRTRSVERRIPRDLPPALREFVNPDRSTTSIRSYINDRNHDRERRTQLELEPRQPNLIQLAAAESANESGHSTPSGTDLATMAGLLRSTIGTDSLNNQWGEYDSLYRPRFPVDPPIDITTRARVREDEDRRDFANRLREPWRPLDDHSQISVVVRDDNIMILASSRLGSPDTVGCTWSEDGRILYIGAEDGIHEYHVNIAARKVFPSLVLR